MAFQPFKVIKNIINGLNKPSSVLRGAVLPSGNYKTIASAAKGIINYNPTNADYSSVRHRKSSDSVYVYPLDHKDQEHYILFDIIKSNLKFVIIWMVYRMSLILDSLRALSMNYIKRYFF